MSVRFSLLGLVALVSFAGLASAALVRPGPQWLSVVVTLTVLMVVAQSLRAVLQEGESRAAAVGWLLFAGAYLALTIGPWLGDVVGPNLLGSKALNYAQVQWRKESPAAPSVEGLRRLSLDLTGIPTVFDGTSNSLFWATDVNTSGWVYRTQVDSLWGGNPVPVNCFQQSGQWLMSWLAGWLGAAIAIVLWRRSVAAAQCCGGAVSSGPRARDGELKKADESGGRVC